MHNSMLNGVFRPAVAALGILWLMLPGTVRGADFPAAWMGNAYWKDGRAEFDVYEGTLARYGEPQPAEVIHIYVREDFAPESHVKADDWQRPGVYPVLKLNQILRVHTGVYVYQQMHSAFWKTDDGDLLKWSLTSNDSCGNTFKLADREEGGEDWNLRFFTYWEGMTEGNETFTPPPDGIFYDELPARVRSLDFSTDRGTQFFQLAPSVIQSKHVPVSFAPATLDFVRDVATNRILVTVAHAGGKDHFSLDARFPYLLREWQMANGGVLKLKESLKLDYWNYNKPGDAERAMGDPRLRSTR